MTTVYLYEPTNLEVPQLSPEEIRALGLGEIQVYSQEGNDVWVGLGPFGQYIDYKFMLNNVYSYDPAVTEMTAWWQQRLEFTVTDTWIPTSAFNNFEFGKPLSATGIFSWNDTVVGSWGNDLAYGHEGDDAIYGEGGDDILWGGVGSDVVMGGAGRNSFLWEADGYYDEIWIQYDGQADSIYSLDPFDVIFVDGVESHEIGVIPVEGGLGIFARGSHEATYFGGNLTAQQLYDMTW